MPFWCEIYTSFRGYLEDLKRMLWVVQEGVGGVRHKIATLIEETRLNGNNITCLESRIGDLDGNMCEQIALMDEVKKNLEQ